MRRYAAPALCILLLTACASTKPANLLEARSIVGTDNDVRIDAQIYGDELAPNINVPVKYSITNHRQTTILVADLLPDAAYDPDTHTVTVSIGSEIPGQEFLPRLIPIRPGESKSFSTAARVSIRAAFESPVGPRPNALRLKLNFLGGNAVPFEKLISIPERAVRDPALASQIFTKWIEGNETVTTNTLPMHWIGEANGEPTPAAMPGRRGKG